MMTMTMPRSPRADTPHDAVALLLECHDRIRTFVSLALAAGTRVDPPDAEIVAACLRVERYFTEALPLHVADEEESVLPRLRGHSPDVDRALRTMQDQHAGHEPQLHALLAAASAVREAPHDASRRVALAAAATDLERAFTEHLALEEAVLFPALRRSLSAGAQAELVAELRARRGVAPAPPPAARDLALRHLTSAFALPTVAAKRRVGARLMAFLAPRQQLAGPQTWERVVAGVERAVATGRCEALMEAIDAIEEQRLARVAGRVCRSVV